VDSDGRGIRSFLSQPPPPFIPLFFFFLFTLCSPLRVGFLDRPISSALFFQFCVRWWLLPSSYASILSLGRNQVFPCGPLPADLAQTPSLSPLFLLKKSPPPHPRWEEIRSTLGPYFGPFFHLRYGLPFPWLTSPSSSATCFPPPFMANTFLPTSGATYAPIPHLRILFRTKERGKDPPTRHRHAEAAGVPVTSFSFSTLQEFSFLPDEGIDGPTLGERAPPCLLY